MSQQNIPQEEIQPVSEEKFEELLKTFYQKLKT